MIGYTPPYDIQNYTDQYGNKQLRKRTNISFLVTNGKIETGEVINRQKHVYINGLYETRIQNELQTNQFKCVYDRGTIYLHPSKEGQWVVATYFAEERILFNAENVKVKSDKFSHDNLHEVLDEVNNRVDNLVSSYDQNVSEVNNRIDNLIIGQGNSPAETVDARVDTVNGITYDLLSDRLNQTSLNVKNNKTEINNINQIYPTYKNTFSGTLRIAFHYNYETSQEKINLLKSLGFNCIYMFRGVSWLVIPDRLKAFLDLMERNGIYVILPVDHGALTSSNPDDVAVAKQWISINTNHNAVIGFSTYDEPVSGHYPKDKQILIYNRIKEVATKDVYMTEHSQYVSTLNEYYCPEACDVLCLDNYTNYLSGGQPYYNTPQKIKSFLFEAVTLMNNLFITSNVKKVIPVLAFFSGSGPFGLITAIDLKNTLDVYSLFGFDSFGAFAFDVSFQPDLLENSIDTSPYLQKLCTNLMTGISKSKQDVVILKPNGYTLNKSYVSGDNLKYTGGAFDKITIDQYTADGYLIIRLDVNSNSKELYITTRAQNRGDSRNRYLSHSYSIDGTNFINPIQHTFYSGIDNIFTDVFTLPNNISAVYVKVQLFNGGVQFDNTLVGIDSIVCSVI